MNLSVGIIKMEDHESSDSKFGVQIMHVEKAIAGTRDMQASINGD